MSKERVIMLKCPRCGTIFPLESNKEVRCPKCGVRIELVAVADDYFEKQLSQLFIKFLDKAVETVFNAIQLRLEEKKTTSNLKTKLNKWRGKHDRDNKG